MTQYDFLADAATHRLVCEHAFINCSRVISRRNLHAIGSTAKIHAFLQAETQNLVLDLIASLPAVLEERISIHEKWPKTWWDAFKDRWFPAWAKRRWPVEWNQIDIDQPIYAAVCPHLDLSGLDHRDRHIRWLWDNKPKAPQNEMVSAPTQSGR